MGNRSFDRGEERLVTVKIMLEALVTESCTEHHGGQPSEIARVHMRSIETTLGWWSMFMLVSDVLSPLLYAQGSWHLIAETNRPMRVAEEKRTRQPLPQCVDRYVPFYS